MTVQCAAALMRDCATSRQDSVTQQSKEGHVLIVLFTMSVHQTSRSSATMAYLKTTAMSAAARLVRIAIQQQASAHLPAMMVHPGATAHLFSHGTA